MSNSSTERKNPSSLTENEHVLTDVDKNNCIAFIIMISIIALALFSPYISIERDIWQPILVKFGCPSIDERNRNELAFLLTKDAQFPSECINAVFDGIWTKLKELNKLPSAEDIVRQTIIYSLLPSYIHRLKNEQANQIKNKVLGDLYNSEVQSLLNEYKRRGSIKMGQWDFSAERLRSNFMKNQKEMKEYLISKAQTYADDMTKIL